MNVEQNLHRILLEGVDRGWWILFSNGDINSADEWD